jgi:hypothetical protein
MRIDSSALSEFYESISDEELLALNREELTDAAQYAYDSEISRRKLIKFPVTAEVETCDDALMSFKDDTYAGESADQNSLSEESACVCYFDAYPGSSAAEDAARAQVALREAKIPSQLLVRREPEKSFDTIYLHVPPKYALHAGSILDRDLFNEKFEQEWREQIKMLSDADLKDLDPEIFCAGPLDKAARMKRAYAEEIANRKLAKKASG